MNEKIGYAIMIQEITKVDVNKSYDSIMRIEVEEIDVGRLMKYILKIAKLPDKKSVQV